jgi:hypothetical protein
MSTKPSDRVTAEVVDALWVEAIERSSTVVGTHERVEALLRLVSAENPVVNRGMLDLHSLTRSGDPPLTDLVNARAYWLTELEGLHVIGEARG